MVLVSTSKCSAKVICNEEYKDVRFKQIKCGKSNKIQLCALCCCGGSRGEGILCFKLKFEIFYSGREILVAHTNLL